MRFLSDLGLDPDNRLWVRDAEGQKYHLTITKINGVDVMSLVKADELAMQPTLETMPVHAELQ